MRFFLVLATILSGCVGAPHTDSFKPTGTIEKTYFERADRAVYPDDVRAALEKYKSVTMAWPGIVTAIKLIDPKGEPYLIWQISAKHHYYDWLIDYGLQRERFLLSPKGEGSFKVDVLVNRHDNEADQVKANDRILTSFAVGNMIIAYGKPDKIENGVVHLADGFANSVDHDLVSTTQMTYGRQLRK